MVKLMGLLDIVAAFAIVSLLVGVEVPITIAIFIAIFETLKGITSLFASLQ